MTDPTMLTGQAMRRAQATEWLATQRLADEMRTHADELDARVSQLRAELAAIERDAPRLRAAARALSHSGRRPLYVREIEAETELGKQREAATLRTTSSLSPTERELEGRDVAYSTSGGERDDSEAVA
jgi:hypothetical protein